VKSNRRPSKHSSLLLGRPGKTFTKFVSKQLKVLEIRITWRIKITDGDAHIPKPLEGIMQSHYHKRFKRNFFTARNIKCIDTQPF